MSPWTALLESLHSALIDELVERHPDPKPELGLPLRQNRFAIPSPEVEQILLVEVGFAASQGIAALASQKGFMKAVSLEPSLLWQAMLHRAKAEFSRRQIQPKLSSAQQLQATAAFPPSTLRCSRVIWIPVRVPGGQCFFGVGA